MFQIDPGIAIIIGLALVAGGVVYFTHRRKADKPAAAAPVPGQAIPVAAVPAAASPAAPAPPVAIPVAVPAAVTPVPGQAIPVAAVPVAASPAAPAPPVAIPVAVPAAVTPVAAPAPQPAPAPAVAPQPPTEAELLAVARADPRWGEWLRDQLLYQNRLYDSMLNAAALGWTAQQRVDRFFDPRYLPLTDQVQPPSDYKSIGPIPAAPIAAGTDNATAAAIKALNQMLSPVSADELLLSGDRSSVGRAVEYILDMPWPEPNNPRDAYYSYTGPWRAMLDAFYLAHKGESAMRQ